MAGTTAASLVKQAKRLKRKVERERAGHFIAEGAQIIEAAIMAGVEIIGVLYREDTDLPAFISNVPVFSISNSDYQEISDTVTPQGILAIVSKPNYELAQLPKSPKTLIYLEEIQDPGNLGTIIRTADAFGADGVLLSPGCTDPFNEKCVRSSAGSIFNIPVISDVDLSTLSKIRQELGCKLVVTDLKAPDLLTDPSIYDRQPVIWGIGNEANGVSPELKQASDKLVKIPMLGKAESLNAAIAAGVCLYVSAVRILATKA